MMRQTFRNLLEKGGRGEKFIGAYIMSNDDFVIEVMKMAGFDFVMLDLEHERLTLSEIMPLIYKCEACGMAVAVRVPGVEEEYIKKALDMGATCIKVPGISTVAEAEKVVEWAKFPPYGHRGACPFVRGYPQYEGDHCRRGRGLLFDRTGGSVCDAGSARRGVPPQGDPGGPGLRRFMPAIRKATLRADRWTR